MRQHPQRAKRKTREAAYAMTRIDQYWTKTFGT
jgi:hypothetical protein